MKRLKQPALRTVLGQPSWRLATPQVEVFVTRQGGHVGPVKFKLEGRRTLAPFSVAPWAQEQEIQRDRNTPDIIKVLRGDFFCMPFGGNATPYRGERHPVHGETANAKWKFESKAGDSLRLSLRTKIRRARIEKTIRLRRGDRAIYSRHVISEARGPMNFGHHAMLQFPDSPGSGLVSTSPFVYGQVYPKPVEQPENRGYSILKPGAEFDSIERVPMITGETTDLSRYPARRGFEDLVMLISVPDPPFAWTAVSFPNEGFVWFALKDPRVLPNTIFWISNGGRHYAPWNSRHVNVMGLEEVIGNFHEGLAESAAENPLSRRGYKTSVPLDPNRTLVVNYIMAVAAIPRGFDRVTSIEPSGADGVVLRSASGQRVAAPLDLAFLQGGGG
jgi:hypothetical protein